MRRSVGRLTAGVKAGTRYVLNLSLASTQPDTASEVFVSVRYFNGGQHELVTVPEGLVQSSIYGPGFELSVPPGAAQAISQELHAPPRAKFVEFSVHPLSEMPSELTGPLELIHADEDRRLTPRAEIAPLMRIDYLGEFSQTAQGATWIKLEGTLHFSDGPCEGMRVLLTPAWYTDQGLASAPDQAMVGCQFMPGFGKSRQVTLIPTEDGRSATFREPFYVPRGAPHGTFQLIMLDGQPGDVSLADTRISTIDRDDVLDVDTLDHLTPHQLGSAAEIADFLWDLPARARIYTALAALDPGSETQARKARHIQGALGELNTAWLPDLPATRSYEPDPQAVLHLLKVTYPDESSGGAVRSTNMMAAQAASGMHPVAALPLAAPRHADSLTGRDGLTEQQRDGVTYGYLDFKAYDHRAVPLTSLLSFETMMHQRLVERHRVSLIHAASGFRGYENALKGLSLARANNLPLVYEVRSFHEHTWRPISRTEASDGLTELRKRQEERCMADADAVVTIAEAMVENLHARGVPREKLFFVPNSIEQEFETLAPIEPSDDLRRQHGMGGRTTLGYISNFSLREGHIILFEAFAQLVEAGADLHLVLPGDGSERKTIQEAARARGLSDRVTLPGNVDHSQIKAWYRTIDLFIVPRIEDFASDYVTPLKPFEAMSQLVPVLMSDRPVTAEIAGPNQERAGVFASGDVGALVACVRECLATPDRLADRAARARDWVLAERVWAETVKRYEPAYAYARAAHASKAGEH